MYIYPFDANWTLEYEVEKKELTSCCGAPIDVVHIGSTAVEGLYAKNCIDILGVVNNIDDIECLKEHLISCGYLYRGEYGIIGRQYFVKEQPKVHLHIFQQGDENIRKHMNFVEIMRATPALVAELNQIKQKLHQVFPTDKSAYQKGKAFFYERINALPNETSFDARGIELK